MGPAGGDTVPHLSGRDEDVAGVGLVLVCFVALVWQATIPGLDQWCRLAEDRLGEPPSGALAGASAGRLVTSGAVAMDWCSQASSCATATSCGMG